MRIGARDSMEKTRVKAFQPQWIDDVAVLIVPPWFLIAAFAFLTAPSNWSCVAFISGAVLLMTGAGAKPEAMRCAYAAVA